jgi:hypothetical protein
MSNGGDIDIEKLHARHVRLSWAAIWACASAVGTLIAVAFYIGVRCTQVKSDFDKGFDSLRSDIKAISKHVDSDYNWPDHNKAFSELAIDNRDLVVRGFSTRRWNRDEKTTEVKQ